MGLGLDLYIPSEKIIMHSLGITFPEVQLTMSLYMYVFGCGQLVLGPLSDRLGQKKLLIASTIMFSLGSFIIVQTQDFNILLWGRALEAFGACGASVSVLALVRDHYEGRIAIRAFTYIRGVSSFAPILAPGIGAFLAVHYGWRSDFVFLGLFALVAFFFCFKIRYLPRPTSGTQVRTLSIKGYYKILINQTFQQYALVAALGEVIMFGYFSSAPVVYLYLLDISEKQFALLFSVNAFMYVLVAFGLGNWISNIGIHKSIRLGASLYILAGLLMFGLHYVHGLHLYTMLIPCMVASAGCAFVLGSASSGALAPFKKQTGKAAALFGCAEFMLGGFFGSLVVYNPMINSIPVGLMMFTVGCLIWVVMAAYRR